jgi:hypothetical protein
MTAAIRPISTGRQWADRPAVDTRVSRAEQDDQMPAVGAPSFWMLLIWAASPFVAIGIGSLLASLLSR